MLGVVTSHFSLDLPPDVYGLLTTAFAVPVAVRRAGSIPVCSCHRHADEVSAVPTVFFSSPGSNVDCLVWWSIMSSGKLPAVDQAGASPTPSTPLPGTFLGLALVLGSDRLYDLVKDIPDVMGLRALRSSAAIVKVMSVPDSRCVSVVT